jgi:hypothetical protein
MALGNRMSLVADRGLLVEAQVLEILLSKECSHRPVVPVPTSWQYS